MIDISAPAPPFDAAAARYDQDFTETRLGRWLREAVQARLAQAFPPGSHVLELACGTGEDAVWLARRGVHVVATDASPSMIEIARAKAARTGMSDRVACHVLRLEDLGTTMDDGRWTIEDEAIGNTQYAIRHHIFDGAFSNFGGLNCVADLRLVAQGLAQLVRPGGKVVLVIMGPWCPWEMAWYLGHLQPRQALRRLGRGGATAEIGGQTMRVYYPSPGATMKAFAPWFAPTGLYGVGAFLSPSYLGGLADRWPTLFTRLAAWERRLAHRWPLTYLNDHYLLELTRTEAYA
jgi:SAM-dependent methyltransferase